MWLKPECGVTSNLWILLFLILPAVCCTNLSPGNAVVLPEIPFEKLSEYHFFEEPLINLRPAERVLPYDLITPLFSDYAQKARFIWMPEGVSATLAEGEEIDFPVGTVLIKNFYYPADQNKQKTMVETRLLIKRENQWDPLTYIWNEEQNDASLEIAGDFRKINSHRPDGEEFTIDYSIPNLNQCKGCHERNRKVVPVGPTLENLNRTYAYQDGEKNQLEKWSELNYLNGLDPGADHDKLADWSDPTAPLHDRALAYLQVNCGTCHHNEGPANVSGLRLTTEEENLFNLGVNKPPVSAGKGSGGLKYDIVPGKPDESILVYRMESLEPGAMMPEMGRKLVHREGVQLIRKWIEEMEQ
ncbi:MAG: hypothetical protein KDC80_22220 [Saprospiraceae bacterium]|nr:hypothetical protein [Saprospiraceae bacterium]